MHLFFLSNIKCLSKAILSCVLVPAISFDDIEYIKKIEKKSDPKKYLKIWRVDHSKGTLHVKSLKKNRKSSLCHFLPSSTQSTSTAHHAPARSASPPAHFMSLCLCVSPNIYPANSLKNTIMWFWSWLDMPEYYQRSNNGPISRFAHKLSITISDSQWIWGSGFIIYGSDWEKKEAARVFFIIF